MLPQGNPAPETVTLYGTDGLGNCLATPKTEFNLGEAVCAKVEGIPLGLSRRITWVDPEGFIEKSTPVIADGQLDLWTNPTAPTGLIADYFVVRNVGTWRANLITSRGSVRASAFYTVSDPANATSDLAININALGADNPGQGSAVLFLVSVTNNGPSDAANVHFLDSDFSNMTFNSATQTVGTGFNCTGTGPVDCTIASLPKGSKAEFLLNFTAGAAGSTINNKVSVSSDTTELNTSDNTSEAQPLRVTTGNPAATCALNCPEDVIVNANTTQDGQSGAVVSFPGTDGDDGCGSVSTTPQSGTFFAVGTHVITSTSSQGGGSCTFTVTVLGASPVTIACPGNVTAQAAEGSCEATSVTLGTPTTTGNGVEVEGTRSDGVALSDPYPGGVTSVTWRATDSLGNTATCVQTVTVAVTDTTPPTITAPPNVTTSTGGTATAACGAIVGESVLGAAQADDNCSVNVSRTGIPSGNFFPVGTTTITYTATDLAGNTATATQTVTVTEDTPPLVMLNGDDPLTDEVETQTLTIECGAPFTDPGATATDSCAPPNTTLQVSATTIDTHTAGVQVITYSATDVSGNVGTATRTINVVDTTAPVIALNGADPLTVECHTNFTDPGATASDGCAGDFAATPSSNVNVDVPGTYSITYSASDPSGNAATPVTRTVTVVDTTAPVVTAPPDVTVNTGANATSCSAVVGDGLLGTGTANDSCQGALSANRSGVPAGNIFPVGETLVTYTSTDAHGNTGSATQKVTVIDNTPPTITVPPDITVYLPLNTPDTSMPVSYPIPATATDNCAGQVTIGYSHASGSTFPMGTTVVTVTATDIYGNSSTATFKVTVLYNFTGFFQPVANLPTLNVVNAGRGVPVKFSLSGNKGLNIFAPNNPSSGLITCNSNDPAVDLTATVTAGGSSLSYDASSDQYNYVWKTESSWAGTCRQLVLQLNDGTFHRANFKFK